MRTKREKETGHCRICCGNRRSDVPSKTLTLDFIRIRCVGANTIEMILHQIWFPLFTEQVCNESEVLRKFWSQSRGASYQLFRSSLSAHFHLGKRFIRISRGIWNSNLCLLILDLGQPLPPPWSEHVWSQIWGRGRRREMLLIMMMMMKMPQILHSPIFHRLNIIIGRRGNINTWKTVVTWKCWICGCCWR